MKITLSVIKADIGGWVGHSAIHPALEESARQSLETAKTGGQIIDYHVSSCGDDLELIMTHTKGIDSEPIHHLAWDTFMTGTGVAKKLKLYGAGQDLLADAFAAFGEVSSSSIIKDKFSGESRGFGFVEMPNKEPLFERKGRMPPKGEFALFYFGGDFP